MRVRGMGLRLVLCTWVWLFTGAVGWAAEQVESLLSPATLEEAFTGLRAEAEGRREAAVAFLIEQGTSRCCRGWMRFVPMRTAAFAKPSSRLPMPGNIEPTWGAPIRTSAVRLRSISE